MRIEFNPDYDDGELAGDAAIKACWAAYKLGQQSVTGNVILEYAGFSGCEKLKNFYIVLKTKEQ
jgi:hypothetical protein